MDDKEIADKIKESSEIEAKSNKDSALNLKKHVCSTRDSVDKAEILGEAESFAELAHDSRCPSCDSESEGEKADHEASKE